MKIALLGYGKMGKAIEVEALKNGHTIIFQIDSEEDWVEGVKLLPRVDVAIEFSMPATAVGNIRKCFKAGTPVVVGTTGWEKEFELVKQECVTGDKAIFVASNYSIGMNIFFEANKQLARVMNRFDRYDVKIEELHHKQKLDAPSGTAKELARQIIGNIDRKSKWVNGPVESSDELLVDSLREGDAPGTHTIKYTSEMDEIEIKHTAFDRRVFAVGTVMAAEWLFGKKGFFGMSDMLFSSK